MTDTDSRAESGLHPAGEHAVTVPLTGQQYQISAGRYRATVTGLGAGLRELLYGDQPMIAGYGPDEMPPAAAGQLLAPWPNRIAGGRYAFGGAEHQLALTEPGSGNAIHGLTRWLAWTPVRHQASSVVLRLAPHGQQGYPSVTSSQALNGAAPEFSRFGGCYRHRLTR